MNYNIEIDEIYGIINISFFDKTSHEDYHKARDELLEISRARGVKKILIDPQELKFDGRLSTTTLFEFGLSSALMAFGGGIKIAAIPPKDHKVRQEVGFVENIGVNRGLLAHSFKDISEARKWSRSF